MAPLVNLWTVVDTTRSIGNKNPRLYGDFRTIMDVAGLLNGAGAVIFS